MRLAIIPHTRALAWTHITNSAQELPPPFRRLSRSWCLCHQSPCGVLGRPFDLSRFCSRHLPVELLVRGLGMNPRRRYYQLMAFETSGMNITACITTYHRLWYNRMPHQRIDGRSVDELLHRFPRGRREHEQNAIAAPTCEESPVWRKL